MPFCLSNYRQNLCSILYCHILCPLPRRLLQFTARSTQPPSCSLFFSLIPVPMLCWVLSYLSLLLSVNWNSHMGGARIAAFIFRTWLIRHVLLTKHFREWGSTFSPPPWKVDALLLTLKLRKMLHRVVKQLARGHTASDGAETRSHFFREFTGLRRLSSQDDTFIQLSPQVSYNS